MRQNFLTKALKYSWVLVLAVVVTATSCKPEPVEPTPTVEDGWYVKGSGTALTELDAKGLMKVTRNEVGQTDRASLLELYIAVKGGSGGFNIVNVVGGTPASYGAGTDFAVVPEADRTNDEPKVDFWRGSYATSETAITVSTDGLYHVVIDTELKKLIVVPVAWGMIGGATPNGWGSSTPMTASTFDLNTITYSITDMELRGGDWKFRYSEGWKVEIDTTDSNPDNHVKVNTNYGGAVDALVPGGDNIVNSAPGVYTCELVWTLGSAYSATLTKTADLPGTNWTDVICDAVGTGVSSDNASAIADPSSWGWGNKLLADGVPTIDGEVYTWTWSNIILEAGEGFKIRTEDGVAPSNGNGANFDAGLEAVDHTASSANVDAATSGNISVSVKASYNIILTIDAADADAKKIVITDAK